MRIRPFHQLTPAELYAALQLRSQVFVVEQTCIYLDPDGRDAGALHVLGYENGVLAAYTRLFPPGTYRKEASIGRVAVHPDFRGKGLGVAIMKATMDELRARHGNPPIVLSAQSYLQQFYQDLGYKAEGEEYLEDGIPHIQMRYLPR